MSLSIAAPISSAKPVPCFVCDGIACFASLPLQKQQYDAWEFSCSGWVSPSSKAFPPRTVPCAGEASLQSLKQFLTALEFSYLMGKFLGACRAGA